MSLGPLGGILGSTAGAPLSQTKGATAERAARDTTAKETTDTVDIQAEKAAGIGQTDEERQASDRDADGRMAWEWRLRKKASQPEEEAPATGEPSSDGEHQLDLFA